MRKEVTVRLAASPRFYRVFGDGTLEGTTILDPQGQPVAYDGFRLILTAEGSNGVAELEIWRHGEEPRLAHAILEPPLHR